MSTSKITVLTCKKNKTKTKTKNSTCLSASKIIMLACNLYDMYVNIRKKYANLRQIMLTYKLIVFTCNKFMPTWD